MLILSRLIGESVLLFLEDGTTVEIKLLGYKRFKGQEASIIGVDAPKNIKILRTELADYKIPTYENEEDVQE